MGKSRGRPKRGALADMTIHPQREPQYEEPPLDQCELVEGGIVLQLHHELRWNFYLLDDGKMVRFAIMQVAWRDSQWVQIGRIDTVHGTVHRHDLHRSRPNDEQGTKVVLATIPATNGWEVVDRCWQQSLTEMQDGWKERLRRWGGEIE